MKTTERNDGLFRDITETLGQVPEWMREMPDRGLEASGP